MFNLVIIFGLTYKHIPHFTHEMHFENCSNFTDDDINILYTRNVKTPPRVKTPPEGGSHYQKGYVLALVSSKQ
jgi:hypothetical protein